MFSRFMGLARVSVRNGQVRNCYVSADIAVDLLPLFPGRILMNWGGWEIEKKKIGNFNSYCLVGCLDVNVIVGWWK